MLDMKGSIADAKSILGMMSLDYSHPVKIVCEDEHDLDCVIQALQPSKFSCPAAGLSAPEAGIRKNRTGRLAILGRRPVFLLLGGRFCPHTVLAMGGQTRYNVFTLPFAGGARAAN